MYTQLIEAEVTEQRQKDELWVAGPPIPPEIGFTIGEKELVALLEYYYEQILDERMMWLLHGDGSGTRVWAEARFDHIVAALKKLPRIRHRGDATPDDATVDRMIERAKKNGEEKFFRQLRSIGQAEITPEDVRQLRQAIKQLKGGVGHEPSSDREGSSHNAGGQ